MYAVITVRVSDRCNEYNFDELKLFTTEEEAKKYHEKLIADQLAEIKEIFKDEERYNYIVEHDTNYLSDDVWVYGDSTDFTTIFAIMKVDEN